MVFTLRSYANPTQARHDAELVAKKPVHLKLVTFVPGEPLVRDYTWATFLTSRSV